MSILRSSKSLLWNSTRLSAALSLAVASATSLTATPATLPAAASTSAPAPASRPWSPPAFTERQAERDAMVKLIRDYYGLTDQPTLDALSVVPRHEFIPADIAAKAYDDTPLPIPNGQLISQPWIVAYMTYQLQLKKSAKVLEIGTGSGYQAAVLTHFTPNVYTIEIIKPLAQAAATRLKNLGYTTVQTKIADGFNGWPDAAPFDAIIVTCSTGSVPPPLLKQLAPGGRMMIPVGAPFAQQSLMLVTKDAKGTIRSQNLDQKIGTVLFVPLLQKDPTAHESPPTGK